MNEQSNPRLQLICLLVVVILGNKHTLITRMWEVVYFFFSYQNISNPLPSISFLSYHCWKNLLVNKIMC